MHGYVSLDGGEGADADLEAGGSCNNDGSASLDSRKAADLKAAAGGSSNTDSLLYPGIGADENQHRWEFIRKVYGILAVQVVLTTVVSAVAVLYPPVKQIIENNIHVVVVLGFLPLIFLILLRCCHKKHPLNLWLLGLFTVSFSMLVSVICVNTEGTVLLQTLLLTSAVVPSLTAYTFWALKRGKDHNLIVQLSICILIILLVDIITMIFFHSVSISEAIHSGLYALLFSLYLVYDTSRLIKQFTYDEYIWASVILYVDIVNIFINIAQLINNFFRGS